MVLREGNASGIAIGIALAIAGILGAYYLHASKPMGAAGCRLFPETV
jgi:hypothetical protein